MFNAVRRVGARIGVRLVARGMRCLRKRLTVTGRRTSATGTVHRSFQRRVRGVSLLLGRRGPRRTVRCVRRFVRDLSTTDRVSFYPRVATGTVLGGFCGRTRGRKVPVSVATSAPRRVAVTSVSFITVLSGLLRGTMGKYVRYNSQSRVAMGLHVGGKGLIVIYDGPYGASLIVRGSVVGPGKAKVRDVLVTVSGCSKGVHCRVRSNVLATYIVLGY